MFKKDPLGTIVDVTLIGIMFAVMVASLLYALEKERELGIAGMSSERILVREEMKNKQK